MMAEPDPEERFLTERRTVGLIGASILATIAYQVGTAISLGSGGMTFTGFDLGLVTVIFFFIFTAVFTLLNYAVWKYD